MGPRRGEVKVFVRTAWWRRHPRLGSRGGVKAPDGGYRWRMKLLRSAAALGIAKKVYDEARKPHNQAKIKSAVDRARSRRKPPRH
jgi:hypothetical protein